MMHAMILSAGRGRRMGALTDHTPKPLLLVKGQPLITYHLKALAEAKVKNIVINLGYLGEKIEALLGDGHAFGVRIHYSYEDPILETAGGIKKALPLLGEKPFIVMSADIFTDFPFHTLNREPKGMAHLVLTDNPPFHPKGDYALAEGRVSESGETLLNFAGIGLYRPELFDACPKGAYPLGKLLKDSIRNGQITGEYYSGLWHNVGTSEQLQEVEQLFLNV